MQINKSDSKENGVKCQFSDFYDPFMENTYGELICGENMPYVTVTQNSPKSFPGSHSDGVHLRDRQPNGSMKKKFKGWEIHPPEPIEQPVIAAYENDSFDYGSFAAEPRGSGSYTIFAL